MHRTAVLAFVSVALLLLGAGGCVGGHRQAKAPLLRGADVLLVTIDTLRADALGFAGNARVKTPTLDRLAAAGRVFSDAHAHSVVTLPSHVNILTGLYPYQHGVRENSGFVLAPAVPTLGTFLGKAGYATAAFVAAYPLDRRYGLWHGFATYDDSYPRGSDPDRFVLAERRGDQVVAPALAWWRQQRGHRRFLWVHLYDPHAGYEPPEPFRSRYRQEPYLGEVAATDAFLAPLLGPFLDGDEPAALVVVTADHGEALGEHGELTHGLFAYEETLRVPLVVWYPGIRSGRDGRPARHVDIVPTVLATLGLAAPPELHGRSLLAPAPPDTTSYFESLSTCLNRGWAPLRGMIRDRHKYIELPLPELYDLGADSAEEHNLVADERRTAHALRAALPVESAWPPRAGAVSAEEAGALRSLGYAAGAVPPKAAYGEADDPKRLVELDHRLHQTIDAYSRGRYEEAVRLAREVVTARPQMAEGYEHLALALRQLDRPGEAIAVLREALARGAERESLHRQLGLTLAESGQAAAAVEVLAPLSRVAGADPQTLDALGIALSDSGRHEEAQRTLERAVAEYPQDPKGYENLGIVLLRRGDAKGARARLEAALALNPRLPISWNTLGVALYQLEGPAAAVGAWGKAVEIDAHQFDALFNLGLVSAALGKPAQARDALSRFVATAPRSRARDVEEARRMLAQLPG